MGERMNVAQCIQHCVLHCLILLSNKYIEIFANNLSGNFHLVCCTYITLHELLKEKNQSNFLAILFFSMPVFYNLYILCFFFRFLLFNRAVGQLIYLLICLWIDSIEELHCWKGKASMPICSIFIAICILYSVANTET